MPPKTVPSETAHLVAIVGPLRSALRLAAALRETERARINAERPICQVLSVQPETALTPAEQAALDAELALGALIAPAPSRDEGGMWCALDGHAATALCDADLVILAADAPPAVARAVRLVAGNAAVCVRDETQPSDASCES